MKTCTTWQMIRSASRLVRDLDWIAMDKRKYMGCDRRIPFCIVQAFLERICSMVVGQAFQQKKYKTPWWFPIASKMEFWFRNRETYTIKAWENPR